MKNNRRVTCALVVALASQVACTPPLATKAGQAASSKQGSTFTKQELARPRADASDRTVIRHASMSIEVSDVSAAAQEAERIVEAAGGYVESTRSEDDQHAHLTIRIPDRELESTIERLVPLGRVRDRNIAATDVTETTVDLEAKLANFRSVRDRLKAHLKRATALKEIMEIERELNRVQTEIDSLEGRLRHIRQMASMATLHVTLERKRVLGPLGWFFWAIKETAVRLVYLR